MTQKPLTETEIGRIEERLGYTIAASEWHRHANGGGFIHADAAVRDDVYVGKHVVVRRGTIKGGTIWGGTIKGGTIWGGTIWGGTIKGGTIEGGTIWGGTIEGGTIWGGTIKGGTIWGGTIKGGTIWGGTIWGGTIKGGTIEGGTIWGGTIEGGTIKGGTIWGGTIGGGTIKGGTIEGGTIWGGTIEGGTWNRQPLTVLGSYYPVTNSAPGQITVGCQSHNFAWWQKNGVKLGKEQGWCDKQIEEYRVLIEFVIAHGVPAKTKEGVDDE